MRRAFHRSQTRRLYQRGSPHLFPSGCRRTAVIGDGLATEATHHDAAVTDDALATRALHHVAVGIDGDVVEVIGTLSVAVHHVALTASVLAELLLQHLYAMCGHRVTSAMSDQWVTSIRNVDRKTSSPVAGFYCCVAGTTMTSLTPVRRPRSVGEVGRFGVS